MTIPQLIDLYKQAKQIHVDAIKAYVEVEQLIRASADEAELANMAYSLREIENLLEDVRIRSYHQRSIAEKLVAALVVSNGECTIRTEYVTATAKSSTMVAIPDHKKNPEHYKQMMDFLGIPAHLLTHNGEALLKPHWPGLVSYLAEMQEQGKPLPPGVDPDKTWVSYKLHMRGKMKPDGTPAKEAKQEVEADEVPF